MSYSVKTLKAVQAAPKTLGNQLGRWAVHLDFSVTQIAEVTGASRQTVYNWITGKHTVIGPYQPRVEKLLGILMKSTNNEQAWSKACQEFNIQL
jgi:predicted DNA-binding protein YlxM (UPF0122 family)